MTELSNYKWCGASQAACSERTKEIQCAFTARLLCRHSTMDYMLYNPQHSPGMDRSCFGGRWTAFQKCVARLSPGEVVKSKYIIASLFTFTRLLRAKQTIANPPKHQSSKAKATEPPPFDQSLLPLTPIQSLSRISGLSTRDQPGDSCLESKYQMTVQKHGTFTNIIDAINKLLAHVIAPLTATPQAVPPHLDIKQEDLSADKTYSFHLKHFPKYPMALHCSIHSNYKTLNHSHTSLVLRGLTTVTAVVSSKKPKDIFKSLCTRCKRGDRQHKVLLINTAKKTCSTVCMIQPSFDSQSLCCAKTSSHVNRVWITAWLEHAACQLQARLESNDQTLAEFQDFYLELKQQNIIMKELFGLILQSVIKPPLNVDENSFQITQVEGKLMSGSADNPILINRLQHQPGQVQFQQQQKGKQHETPGKPSLKALIETTAGALAIGHPHATNLAHSGTSLGSRHELATYGNSVFFCLECKLAKPISVLLMSRKTSLFLTGIGSLRIPTPNGTIRIKPVYHNPSILQLQ
ncbi:hypothetical protein VP01_153g1 [Puccinia sorghi]|uniref:Uncharacterized protein n=1 Tax=Puccinia sorghi TaxID=27349 RepID=A0A0L6VIJ0_9BASI|nr:hypothetical protein VP01_153g1 [Puccinia sorghi]